MGWRGFLLTLFCTMSLFVGLAHIGFALTEPAPRNTWDWYVIVMGIGAFALYFPTALWMIHKPKKPRHP